MNPHSKLRLDHVQAPWRVSRIKEAWTDMKIYCVSCICSPLQPLKFLPDFFLWRNNHFPYSVSGLFRILPCCRRSILYLFPHHPFQQRPGQVKKVKIAWLLIDYHKYISWGCFLSDKDNACYKCKCSGQKVFSICQFRSISHGNKWSNNYSQSQTSTGRKRKDENQIKSPNNRC